MRDFFKALSVCLACLGGIIGLAIGFILLSDSSIGYWTIYYIGFAIVGLYAFGAALFER